MVNLAVNTTHGQHRIRPNQPWWQDVLLMSHTHGEFQLSIQKLPCHMDLSTQYGDILNSPG